jgi:hypothetical protein
VEKLRRSPGEEPPTRNPAESGSCQGSGYRTLVHGTEHRSDISQLTPFRGRAQDVPVQYSNQRVRPLAGAKRRCPFDERSANSCDA